MSVVRCVRCSARLFKGAKCKGPRCVRPMVYDASTDSHPGGHPSRAVEVYVTARPKYAYDADGHGSSIYGVPDSEFSGRGVGG